MPSTYLSLHYHIVFSTKNREPLLDPAWRKRLHEFLGGTVRGSIPSPKKSAACRITSIFS